MIHPSRVAEVIGSSPRSPGTRGSGYLITDTAVLTAAHVVKDITAVMVRVDADREGEWSAPATEAWRDEKLDIAVLRVPKRPGRSDDPSRFGRLAERAAVVSCVAVGFPFFKLRDDPTRPGPTGGLSQYRDMEYAEGRSPVLSNRREGTLELRVEPPGRDLHPPRSPWQGMSGAAVWVRDAIVGVVVKHDGPGRLIASRVDRWYQELRPERLAELVALLGLPERAEELVECVPTSADQLVLSRYRALVDNIAPDRLDDRARELDELEEFCAGDEPYWWITAGAWAGKTSLAAWFVRSPPDGVGVVSFFVTRRLAGQADSDTYLEAVIEQLAAANGEQPSPMLGHARIREYLRLTDQAATAQTRTILVVDGLDEDDSSTVGLPSIASLLPPRTGGNLRVLVLRRPHPGVPDDVRVDHPLRRVRPVMLAASPHARELQTAATSELEAQFRVGGLGVEVLGLLAAAGGDLTMSDLAELTQERETDMRMLIRGRFGRSLVSLPGDKHPVYRFAHDTLHAVAIEQIGSDLRHDRQRLHGWADTYGRQGWPPSTPRYLLRPYGRLLEATGELTRLSSLALDQRRHERMFAETASDFDALAEIATAQRLLGGQTDAALGLQGRLSVTRTFIEEANRNVPTDLPAVWARLGERDRAERLALSMSSSFSRSLALCGLARERPKSEASRRQLLVLAERVARASTNPSHQCWALAQVAGVYAATDPDRTRQLADDVRHRAMVYLEARTLAWLADMLADTDPELSRALINDAQRIARAIPDPTAKMEAMRRLVTALAAADPDRGEGMALSASGQERSFLLMVFAGAIASADPDRAARLVDAADGVQRGWVLARLAASYATTEPIRSRELTDEAERIADATSDHIGRSARLVDMIHVLGTLYPDRASRWADAAEPLIRSIAGSARRAEALSALADALVKVDPPRARRLAEEAERAARTRANPYVSDEALGHLACALAGADPDGAERLARSVHDADARVRVLANLVGAFTTADPLRAGRLAREAEHLAGSVHDPGARAEALAELASALAAVDDGAAQRLRREAKKIGRMARRMARKRTSRRGSKAIHKVAYAEAQNYRDLFAMHAAMAAASPERAEALVDEAERKARAAHMPNNALIDLVAVVATVLPDRAEQIAGSIPDVYARVAGFRRMASELAGSDADRAERIARAIPYAGAPEETLVDLIGRFATTDPDRAERVADSLRYSHVYATALTRLADALATVDPDRAERIAKTIPYSDDAAETLTALVRSARERGADATARRLLAAALSVGGWRHPPLLAILDEVEASALTAMADCYVTLAT